MNGLPPGLRGMLLAEEERRRNQMTSLGGLAQLSQIHGSMQDRAMRQQAMLAEQKAAAERRAFFSPQNAQQYVEGGSPETPVEEGLQGPPAPAVPGQMNFDKFMRDAAIRGHVDPAKYMERQDNLQLRRDTLEQNSQIRFAQIEAGIQDSIRRSEDRNRTLEERKAAAERAEELKVMLTNQQNALAVQLKQMGIDSTHALARFTAANRPPQQPPAPTLVYRSNPDGTTTAIDFRTGREMPNVMPPGAATVAAKDAKKKIADPTVGKTFDAAEAILDGKHPETGAPTDTPTGSLIGSGVDLAGSVFGLSPKGSEQASQLKVYAANLATKTPRFEGPQGVLDVKLYQEMMGEVGNDRLPVARRKAALNSARDLYLKYEKPNGGPPTPPTPEAPKVRKYNPATGRIE
jgi:hypothetical protein